MKFLLLSFLAYIFSYQTTTGQFIIKDTLLLAGDKEQFWHSSSELEQSGYYNYGKYGAINLGDNKPATCWAEGSKSNGIGEYIYMTIPKNIRGIKIRNGYQKSKLLYQANNRPKTIKIELLACFMPPGYVTETHIGFTISQTIATNTIILKDKLGYQDVMIDINWNKINHQATENKIFDKDRFILKITIEDIYPGNKWNDACISDIEVIPNPVFEVTADEHGLTKVSENHTDTLFYETDYIYQVIDLTNDDKWIIFILMSSNIGDSRAETVYKLYNTKKEVFIDTENITQMYGFEKKEGKLYLNGINNNFEEINLLLE